MTETGSRIIRNVARWTFQEILPIIILLGIAGLMWILYVTDSGVAFLLAIILSAAAVLLAGLVTFVSARRKWKSTLFAKLGDDKNSNIEIWMRRPIKTKWKGKMDAGKNTGALATIVGVSFENILGTPVINILLKNGSPVILPTRLAEMTAIKEYLGIAVSKQPNKLQFADKDTATKFASFLIMPDKTTQETLKKDALTTVASEAEDKEENVVSVKKVDKVTTKSSTKAITKKSPVAVPLSAEKTNPLSKEAEDVVAKAVMTQKKQIKIDYSEYNEPVKKDNSPVLTDKGSTKVTVKSINDAIEAKIADADSEYKDPIDEIGSVSTITGLGKTTSIDLDLSKLVDNKE